MQSNGDSDIKFSGQRPRFINKNKPPTEDDNGKGFARAQDNGGLSLNASAKPFEMA
jgi:hypothetical protein